MNATILLEDVWEAFGLQLRSFIRTRLDDDATADDILQNVFLKIHTRIDTLSDAGKLESWIYQITRNAITDYYRRNRPLADIPEILAAPPDVDDDYALRKLAPCLRMMIEDLPAHYRDALLATEYEGLTQQALAARAGISLSGAKSRVQRARDRLKAQLLECCHFQLDRAGRIIDYWPRCSCCDGSACTSTCSS